ncbi:MAG TPA: TIGR03086 family metal-binding protein [Acidimicrobiia bacterium]|nr:TIGR03086 family metal-binding protein [Acidimicrobiia bacterium]
METIDLVEQGIAFGRSRIAGIGDTPLDAPTPCADWNLRQLVNHTVNAAATIAEVLSSDGEHDAWGPQARMPQEMADTDTSWPNPVEHYDEVTSVIIRVARNALPDQTFLQGGRRQPAIALARAVTFDSVVHGWDIAVATGQDPTIPTEIAEAYFEFAAPIAELEMPVAVFAPRIEVPASASPTDRLVALLGRQP